MHLRTLLPALALLAAGVCHASLISSTRNGGAVPDDTPAGATFTMNIVSSEIIAIAGNGNVIVTLTGIQHSWVGDLSFVLSHVDTGTSVTLFDRPGVPDFSAIGYRGKLNGTYAFGTGFAANFETAASIGHATNGIITPGNYQPEVSLNAFKGESAGGTWALIVSDKAPGAIANTSWTWTLDIQGTAGLSAAPEPATWLIVGGALIAVGLRRRQA